MEPQLAHMKAPPAASGPGGAGIGTGASLQQACFRALQTQIGMMISILQAELHPSLLFVLPSSQSS